MTGKPKINDALTALREMTLSEIEQRLADLDSERAALSLLQRSLAARDRAKRRLEKQSVDAARYQAKLKAEGNY